MVDGIVRIIINCFERCNVFCLEMVSQLIDVFYCVYCDNVIGIIILIGVGYEVFCLGGDQKVCGIEGYIDEGGMLYFNVFDLQM